ncbi:MAG: hypothetical protein IKZ58_07560 [Selenomonadaceae bacterium]|nr:hypothetical protein [Selenomonadaceae bacterium]
MATREENLKKINDELEKLSDDELEKVAGGITDPWWNDRKINEAIDTNPAANLFTAGYRPKCMPKDSPL